MGAKFELLGSGRGAVDLVRNLNRELDATEKQGGKTAKGFDKIKNAAERFAATGDRVAQYENKLKRLTQFVEAGALSQKKAEAAANRFRLQLEQSNPKVREAAEAEKKRTAELERSRVAMMAQGNSIRQFLETPTERYKRLLRETIKLHRQDAISMETRRRRVRQLKQELEGASSANESAFGPATLGKLGAMTAGVVSLQRGEAKTADPQKA